jgi:hypothetical protein
VLSVSAAAVAAAACWRSLGVARFYFVFNTVGDRRVIECEATVGGWFEAARWTGCGLALRCSVVAVRLVVVAVSFVVVAVTLRLQ